MNNKKIPSTYQIGNMYLVLSNECVYRVRLENVNEMRQEGLCFMVDEGEFRCFGLQKMFVCSSKFLKLAPQAIRFALYGLEELDEFDFARKHIEETLLRAKSLVGQIFTKKDDYIAQESSDALQPVVQVVLYKQLMDDDINLHPVILKKIMADIPAPELSHSTLEQVII